MGVCERGADKKLVGAARYWLGIDDEPVPVALEVDESAAASMRAFGFSEEQIAQSRQGSGAGERPVNLDYEVHDDCWDSVMFFLKLETQWTWVSVGVPMPFGVMLKPMRSGINRTCVESEMRMRGVKRKRQAALLDDLKVMEDAVLEAEALAAAGK